MAKWITTGLITLLIGVYVWAVMHSRNCGGYPCGPDEPTWDPDDTSP